MSTEGIAEVISILSNSLSGVGTLMSKGVMWCGKKMVESYETFSRSFQREYATTPASAMKLEERQQIMVRVIEQLSATPSSSTADDTVAEVAQAFSQASSQHTALPEEYEYNYALRLLKAEIHKCQGFVPTEDIIKARQALDGSLETIRAATGALQQSWTETLDNTDDTQEMRRLQTKQTQDIVERIQQESALLDKLLQQNNGVLKRYDTRLRDIETTVEKARQRIADTSKNDPPKALEDALQAQKDMQALKHIISRTMAEEWDKHVQRLAEAKGRLRALETMIQEATAAQVVPVETKYSTVEENILACRKRIEDAEAQPEQEKVENIFSEIEQLAQQTFRALGEGQQYKIANTVAEALNELGLVSDPATNEPPAVEKIGVSVRVAGFQDGKIIIFNIDRDGEVSYDLNGYKGAECIGAANRIFNALRKRGIMIVDRNGAQKIDQYPVSSLSAEVLQRDEFSPHFDVNKRQTLIQEHIVSILQDRMGFTQILQNSSGGSIVIDAFHGHVGYHVVLSSEGKPTLTKNSSETTQQEEDLLESELSRLILLPTASLSSELVLRVIEPAGEGILSEVVESRESQKTIEDEQVDNQEDIALEGETN